MSSRTAPAARAVTPMVITAFAAVYIIWGSTYLAIRLAVETLPPLLMAGVRFVIAGAILFPIAYLTGDRRGDRVTARHWKSAAVIGALLLFAGNGGISFGEQHVPSGVAALLVATVPLWMAVFAHVRGIQPIARTGAAGLLVGFAGVAILLVAGGSPVSASPLWFAITLASPVFWAAGSIYAGRAPLPRRALVGTAMEMLCGGVILCAAAGVLGEWGQIHPAAISTKSLLAAAYLVVFGSLLGYTAYVFLLRAVSPRAVSSYAYVNPLVAVLLGWALVGERVTAGTLVGGLLIVVAVVVLLASERRPAAERPGSRADAEEAGLELEPVTGGGGGACLDEEEAEIA
ncbi:MAG TPA: EamA family transporter [Candidatus Binatia bacterium]|nr:EamA family transporter [Candidatus Binatia bacterium]